MKSADDIKKLIEQLEDKTRSEFDKQTLDDIFLSMHQEKSDTSQMSKWNIWRIIMKSPITKLAAAAVIILVVLAGIPFFKGTGPAVSLADVYEKMKLVNAYMYKSSDTVTGNIQPGMPSGENKTESTVTISKDYGMKMEIEEVVRNTSKKFSQKIYILPQEKKVYMIMPEQKAYVTIEFDNELVTRIENQTNDPRDIVKKILNCRYTELGRSTINGIEVEGFETTDPTYYGGTIEELRIVLWVDVKTWLPVHMEKSMSTTEQMKRESVLDNFQWDLIVDAKEFEPVIPEDYKNMLPGEMKMPNFDEQAAIEGLKFFLEITGKYPKKLNVYLSQELMAIQDSNNPTEAALRLKDAMKQIDEEGKAQTAMEMMKPIHSLGMFYMLLVQDKKEPAYYGDVVTPADSDKVLLRWKTGDNEYRVVYGSLTAETVSAQKLAELESKLPK